MPQGKAQWWHETVTVTHEFIKSGQLDDRWFGLAVPATGVKVRHWKVDIPKHELGQVPPNQLALIILGTGYPVEVKPRLH